MPNDDNERFSSSEQLTLYERLCNECTPILYPGGRCAIKVVLFLLPKFTILLVRERGEQTFLLHCSFFAQIIATHMRFILLSLFIATATAGYAPSQNSGYEMAEVLQPGPPAPPSAMGGDQQAYNTDIGAGADKPRLNGRASAAGTTIGSYGIMQYISLNGLGPGFVPKAPGSNGNGFLRGGPGSNGGSGNGIPALGSYNAEAGTGYKNRRRLLYRLRRVQH